jgi:hypothetical protein
MRIKKLMLLIATLGTMLTGSLAIAGPAAQVAAYNPLETACESGAAKQSTACDSGTQNEKLTGKDGIIVRVTRIVAAVSGAVAVIMMIYYGVLLTTSYGDSGKATTARNGIIAAAIGLVVIAVSQALVVFLVSNL